MSTNTKHKELKNLFDSDAWGRIWLSLKSDHITSDVSVGYVGDNPKENISFLKKQQIGIVTEVEPNKAYDFVFSTGQISKKTSEYEKDEITFTLGQQANFFCFISVPSKHPLFEDLVPIDTGQGKTDWYLI